MSCAHCISHLGSGGGVDGDQAAAKDVLSSPQRCLLMLALPLCTIVQRCLRREFGGCMILRWLINKRWAETT